MYSDAYFFGKNLFPNQEKQGLVNQTFYKMDHFEAQILSDVLCPRT